MDNIDWIKDVIKRSWWEYKEIACPLFDRWSCADYNNRPSCCRNYPQVWAYCSSTKRCLLWKLWILWQNVESDNHCYSCKDICCNSILVPKRIEFTKEEILKWLDINCEDCRKLF